MPLHRLTTALASRISARPWNPISAIQLHFTNKELGLASSEVEGLPLALQVESQTIIAPAQLTNIHFLMSTSKLAV